MAQFCNAEPELQNLIYFSARPTISRNIRKNILFPFFFRGITVRYIIFEITQNFISKVSRKLHLVPCCSIAASIYQIPEKLYIHISFTLKNKLGKAFHLKSFNIEPFASFA